MWFTATRQGQSAWSVVRVMLPLGSAWKAGASLFGQRHMKVVDRVGNAPTGLNLQGSAAPLCSTHGIRYRNRTDLSRVATGSLTTRASGYENGGRTGLCSLHFRLKAESDTDFTIRPWCARRESDPKLFVGNES